MEVMHRAETAGFAAAWTSSRSYASVFPYAPRRPARPAAARPAQRRDLGHRCVAPRRRRHGRRQTITTWPACWTMCSAPHPAAGRTSRTCRRPAGSGSWSTPSAPCCALVRRQAPQLLVLDDLHCGGSRQSRGRRGAARHRAGPAGGDLVTYRSNWSHGSGGSKRLRAVDVRPLRAEDARRMAAGACRRRDDPGRGDRARSRPIRWQSTLPAGARPRRACIGAGTAASAAGLDSRDAARAARCPPSAMHDVCSGWHPWWGSSSPSRSSPPWPDR